MIDGEAADDGMQQGTGSHPTVFPAMRLPVPESTAEAVLVASRALVALSARSISASSDVTLPQYRMLVVLSMATTNLTGLALQLDVSPSTALRMVDRLELAGLVERTVRPENRRETLLSLTVAGRRTVRTVNRRRLRDIRVVLEQLPDDQQTQLVDAMDALSTAADRVWPGIADTVP